MTKLNPTGSGLVYSSYLGGSGFDHGQSIAVDGAANAYVTGFTTSTDFPTANPIQSVRSGGKDAIVTKLNTTGSALLYSTYLGGSADDEGLSITVDSLPTPNAYVTGLTASTNFPTTAGAFQTTFGGGSFDGFVTKITDVVLPPQTAGKVTGGGTIDVPAGIGNFGFIVRASVAGSIGGNLNYVNHTSGAKIRSVTFTSFLILANTATFSGTCTNNGVPCTFTVEVMDNGEPGPDDMFAISVNAGPTEVGMLRSGNIQIHQ